MTTRFWLLGLILFATPLARPLAQAEGDSSFGSDMLILAGLIVLGIILGLVFAYGPGFFRRRR